MAHQDHNAKPAPLPAEGVKPAQSRDQVNRDHAIAIAKSLIKCVHALSTDPDGPALIQLGSLRDKTLGGMMTARACGLHLLGDWPMLHQATTSMCLARDTEKRDRWLSIVMSLVQLVEVDLARLRARQ